MEMNSSVKDKSLTMEEHFVPERAIFSQQKSDKFEFALQAEFFENVKEPIFGEDVEKPQTRHGVDSMQFEPIEAAQGSAERHGEMIGPTEHFFKPEPPTFE